MRRLLIVLLLLLGVACQPIYAPPDLTSTAAYSTDEPTGWPTNTAIPVDPTPTQMVDFPFLPDKDEVLPGEGFTILNQNPKLEFLDPVRTERIEGGRMIGAAEQCRPRGYEVYNLYENLDGDSGGGHHTRLTEVFADGLGCRADVSTYAGETGITQVVDVTQRGCHIVKMAGAYSIIDAKFVEEDHTYNYGVRPRIRSAQGNRVLVLDRVAFPDLVNTYEYFWPVFFGAPGSYEVTFAASVAYATAEPSSDQRPLGSWIRLAVAVLAYESAGGHCDGNTPSI